MYLHKFSIAGLDKSITIKSKFSSLDPIQKKEIRWSIASNLSLNYLPFHSCLVEKNGKGYLICGPSGSGKSTLSTYFIKLGYRVLANDFVVMWNEKDKIFAGDLNFDYENKDKPLVEITNFIFLSAYDKRDIFKMGRTDVTNFYIECMKPWKVKQTLKFTQSPLFEFVIDSHVCLGNRINTSRWFKSIDRITNNYDSRSVGIVGVGVLGQDIANLLLDIPNLERLNLYSRNFDKIKSIMYDLKSARPDLKINIYRKAISCIKNSNILVFSFRGDDIDNSIKIQERYRRLYTHSKIVWEYTRLLRRVNYSGTILVLSNPVDILSYLTYIYTNLINLGKFDWKGLFSNQIFGVGIGLDYFRLRALHCKNLELIGEHGDMQYLAEASVSNLIIIENKRIQTNIKEYSEMVRKGVDRTRFGPSHETKRIVESFFNNEKELVRLSVMSHSGKFWGRPIMLKCGVPLSIHKLDRKLAYKMKLFEDQAEELIISMKLVGDL